MRKSPRESAMESGEKFYSSGKQCRNGHDDLRYTSSGVCVGCQNEKNARYAAKNSERKNTGSSNGYHSAKAARVSRMELYNLMVFVRGKIMQGISDPESVYNVICKIDDVIGRIE